MVASDIIKFPKTAKPADIVAAMDRDGAVILENPAGLDTVDALERDVAPHLGKTPNGEGPFFGFNTKRMGRLFLKSPAARGLAVLPPILPVVDSLLTRYCSRIQINLTQAIRIEAGERAQILHNDDEFFPLPKPPGMQFMINALWALDDFTEENGATRLVPGSHCLPVTRTPAPETIRSAVMPRGSVLLYAGSALHGGGPNRTARARTGVVISYCLGWLRQAENQYLAYPPAVARQFSPELQRLIGYAIHEPNLGWYEGQDPSIVLTDGRTDYLSARDNMAPEMAAKIAKRYAMTSGDSGKAPTLHPEGR